MTIRIGSLCLFLILAANHTLAQNCDAFSVLAAGDTTLCMPGEPVPLSADFSLAPFALQWSPATGLDDPLSANTIAAPTATQTYTLTAQAIGDNLIFNGDFELGDLGFTTDYSLGSGGPNGPLHSDGEYLISTDPNDTHQDFSPCGDHTSGNGNMMVVNSSGQPNDVWCQVVSVSPSTDYAFSAWVASVFSDNPANLQFSFDGVLLGNTVEAPAATCEWTPFFATWNSGASTTVEICIANVNEAFSGNDFALDDISFGAVCEVSEAVTVTVGTAPGPVLAADCDAATGSMELSWAPVADAGSYIVEVLDAPAGSFTSDTSYLIQGLAENQEVNYELFAVSPEGCSSSAFSGNCFTLSCPAYSLELNGDAEVCEGSSLDLSLNVISDSPGPFTISYTYDGLTNTLPGLQQGINMISVPVAATGTIAVSAFTDGNAPACAYEGSFPTLSFTVVPFPAAGVGTDLAFCAALDSLLDLNAILSGADPGGAWVAFEGDVPASALDMNTGFLNLATLQEAGSYQVGYLQNNSLCQADTAFFNLDILPRPPVDAGGPFSLDCDQTSVTLGGTAIPGVSYVWSPLGSGAVDNPTNANPVTALPGIYTVQVTDDATGCTNADTAEVINDQVELDLLLAVTEPGCNGEADGQIRIDSVIGGQAPYLYRINGGAFQQIPVFEGLSAGSYAVAVQDGGGCTGEVQVTLDSVAPSAIELVTAELSLTPAIGIGDTVELIVQPTGSTSVLPDSLVWNPSVCQGCSRVVVSPEQSTSYTVTGTTAEGCTYTSTIVIQVSAMQRIYVPTAFSPNGDGVNDMLVPYAGAEFKRGVSFRIFNRWGALVHERKDFPLGMSSNGWDGRFKGESSPAGVYGYHLVLELGNGRSVAQTGAVHLIR